VLLADLLGHGGSDAPPEPAAYRPERAVERLAGHFDQLAIERAVFFGHSLGGALGLRFALDYPDRLHALVIINSNSAAGTAQWRNEVRPGMINLAERVTAEGTGFLKKTRLYPGQGKRLDRKSRAALVKAFDSLKPAGLANTARSLVVDVNCAERLGELRVPLLVVIGTRDAEFAANAPAFIAKFPPDLVQVVTLDDAGHAANIEKPKEFETALLAFTDSLGPIPPRPAPGTAWPSRIAPVAAPMAAAAAGLAAPAPMPPAAPAVPPAVLAPEPAPEPPPVAAPAPEPPVDAATAPGEAPAQAEPRPEATAPPAPIESPPPIEPMAEAPPPALADAAHAAAVEPVEEETPVAPPAPVAPTLEPTLPAGSPLAPAAEAAAPAVEPVEEALPAQPEVLPGETPSVEHVPPSEPPAAPGPPPEATGLTGSSPSGPPTPPTDEQQSLPAAALALGAAALTTGESQPAGQIQPQHTYTAAAADAPLPPVTEEEDAAPEEAAAALAPLPLPEAEPLQPATGEPATEDSGPAASNGVHASGNGRAAAAGAVAASVAAGAAAAAALPPPPTAVPPVTPPFEPVPAGDGTPPVPPPPVAAGGGEGEGGARKRPKGLLILMGATLVAAGVGMFVAGAFLLDRGGGSKPPVEPAASTSASTATPTHTATATRTATAVTPTASTSPTATPSASVTGTATVTPTHTPTRTTTPTPTRTPTEAPTSTPTSQPPTLTPTATATPAPPTPTPTATPPGPHVSISGAGSAPVGGLVSLLAVASPEPVTVQWYPNGGTIVNGSNQAAVTMSFPSAGCYTVQAVAVYAGGNQTASHTVAVGGASC
jgi:pimeloyl-ACP methyl ester carboxylesterase